MRTASLRLDTPLAALVVVLLSLAASTVLAQPCSSLDSRALSSAVGCLQQEQLDTIRSLRTGGAGSSDPKQGLALVAEVASCLRSAGATGRETWIPQLICLLQDLLGVSGAAPAGDIAALDRLWRAELTLRFLLLPRSLPLDPPWNWEKLIDQTLAETVEVYRTATEVRRRPDDYFTASAARRLGLDFRNPAPPEAFLDHFVELSLTAAKKYPRKLGPPIGEALDPLLCSAIELYPGRREHWQGAHYMLIAFDGGSLSGTAYLQEFSQRLQSVFRLPPPIWDAPIPPCAEKKVEALMFPRFDLEANRFTEIPADLDRTLRQLERLLSLATESLQDRSRSFSPWQSYARFLWRLAEPLRRPGRGSRAVWELRHRLLEAAASGLRRGIESSGPEASPEGVESVRADLNRLLEEHAAELMRGRRYRELARFLEGFASAEGLLDDGQAQLVHGLAARAYYLDGDVTSAALHASLAPITMAQLEALERRLQALGLGVLQK